MKNLPIFLLLFMYSINSGAAEFSTSYEINFPETAIETYPDVCHEEGSYACMEQEWFRPQQFR